MTKEDAIFFLSRYRTPSLNKHFYEAIGVAIEALRGPVRCNQCKHYEGVHGVPGCAPCDFWGIGAVMWDDFCKRGERND